MDLDEQYPHMKQLRYEKQKYCAVLVMNEKLRILQPDDPLLPYHKVSHHVFSPLYLSSCSWQQRSVIHWGQRKLLLSEIEFLTLYGEDGMWVVYAGAAPGTLLSVSLPLPLSIGEVHTLTISLVCFPHSTSFLSILPRSPPCARN